MGWIWGALSGLIFTKGGAWVAGILAALGLGLVTHQVVIGPALAYAESAFTGMPVVVAEWLGFLKIDVYVSIVGSAYAGAGLKRVFLRKVAA